MSNLKKSIFWCVALIAVGVLSRSIPHPPNFSALLSVAIFAGFVIPGPLALLVPLAAVWLSDLTIGFHQWMWVVYPSLLALVVMGRYLPELSRKPKTWFTWALTGLCGSTLFFVTTNLAVWWFSGMYAPTYDGLVTCFVAAIPFFHNSVASTLLYLGAFEGARQVRPVLGFARP